MFDHLLSELNKNIISQGGKHLKLDNNFGEYFSKNKESYIRSWLWDVPGFRRWRVSRMDAGDKIQVLNSVAYPNYENDQPILGMDLLWFGKQRRIVAVFDFQPLVQDKDYFFRYYKGLENLKSRFQDFNNQKIMHIYDATQYFSPWVLMYIGNIDELNDSLIEVFNCFLKEYCQLRNNDVTGYNKLNHDEVKRLHIAYDRYSAERDPAHGLFKSYFGKEWADDFVEKFLFPHSLMKGK